VNEVQASLEKRRVKEEQRRGQIRLALGGEVDDATMHQVAAIAASEAQRGEATDQFEENPNLVGITTEDVDALVEAKNETQGVSSDTLRVGGRFMKLEDAFPPCPPRGMFDVERIRDSTYFFS